MSLINDALKRAKAAQHHTPASFHPDLQFRPIEPMPPEGRRRSWVWPAALTLAGVSAALVIFLLPRHGSEPQLVRAVGPTPPSLAEPAPVIATLTPPSAPERPSVSPGPPAPKPVTQAATAPESTKAPEAPASTPAALSSAASEGGDIGSALPPAVAEPVPVVPRLQAIIFHPTRPSAMIGGKALFIGDRLGDLRLVAITQETATFVGGGRTNVLTLP